MEKPGKIKELKKELVFFVPPEGEFDFAPWKSGESGEQNFLKLNKNGQAAFLYMGEKSMLEAERQKIFLTLTNQGWEPAGEVKLSFSQDTPDEWENLLPRETLRLELGLQLLALVDPGQGAPLEPRLKAVREEIARETGLLVPGIKITDNLALSPEGYRLYFRESLLARGEIFLGRIMAIGSLEQLSQVEGWSANEPSYRLAAKWIPESELEKARNAGLMAVAPLSVLLTHINRVLKDSAPVLLGLQDLQNLLKLLEDTYPVLVEEFLEDKVKLRSLRKILQNLLSEKISIRDLVTILEIIGERMEEIKDSEKLTEILRASLAGQALAPHLSKEGGLPGVFLSAPLEEMAFHALREERGFCLNKEENELLLDCLRKALQTHQPCVLITEPATRVYWKKLLNSGHTGFPVFSTAEITPETRIEIRETIAMPQELKLILETKSFPQKEDKKNA